MNYFEACEKELVVPLPIFSRIQKRILNLKGYKLSEGVCVGLKNGFKQMDQD